MAPVPQYHGGVGPPATLCYPGKFYFEQAPTPAMIVLSVNQAYGLTRHRAWCLIALSRASIARSRLIPTSPLHIWASTPSVSPPPRALKAGIEKAESISHSVPGEIEARSLVQPPRFAAKTRA